MDSFNRLKDAIKRYMSVAYGFDKLGGVLLIVAAVLLAFAGRGIFLRLVALGIVGWGIWRALSQDHEARAAENAKFEGLISKVTSGFKNAGKRVENSSTRVYVRCPNCGKQFALPKGKGTLRATCPHCGAKSIHTV